MKNPIRVCVEQRLVDIILKGQEPTHLVTAVRLPTGAVEIAVNTTRLSEKLRYIAEAYDNDMRLKTNPTIRMIDLMVVFPE